MLRIDAAGLRSRVSPLTGTGLGLESRERPYRKPERVPKGHDLRELAKRVTTLRKALDPFTRNLSLLAAASEAATNARDVRAESDARAAAAEADAQRMDEQLGTAPPPERRREALEPAPEPAVRAVSNEPSQALREDVRQSLHELASALEGIEGDTAEHDSLDRAAAEVARRLEQEAEQVLRRALGERADDFEAESIEERFGGAQSGHGASADERSFAAEALGLVDPRAAGGAHDGARKTGLAPDDARVARALRTQPRAVARVLGGADGSSGIVGGLRGAAEGAVQRLATQLGPNEGTGILLDVTA